MQLGFSGSHVRSAKAADECAWLRKALARAVKALTPFMARMKGDPSLAIYARIDERSLALICERLGTEPRLEELRELLRWIVQIASHWETRSRMDGRVLRPVIDLKWEYLLGR